MGGEFEMYIPEIVIGVIIGAVCATALIFVAAVIYDKHDKDEVDWHG
jgi:Mg/Co/Ni transporter MgtE